MEKLEITIKAEVLQKMVVLGKQDSKERGWKLNASRLWYNGSVTYARNKA